MTDPAPAESPTAAPPPPPLNESGAALPTPTPARTTSGAAANLHPDIVSAPPPGPPGRGGRGRGAPVRPGPRRRPPQAAAVAPPRSRGGGGPPAGRYVPLEFVSSPWARPDAAAAEPADDAVSTGEDEDDLEADDGAEVIVLDPSAGPGPLAPDGAERGSGQAGPPDGGAVARPPPACGRAAPRRGPAAAAPAPGYNPFGAPWPEAPRAPRVPRPAGLTDPGVVARLGLLRASRTDAALDFAAIPQPSAQELLSVLPAAARVLFCAPRVQAMARVSTPTEEAERSKADKARKSNAGSPWHTHSTDQLQLFVFTAWQVIFQETPNTALLGTQLGLAANWHIADPEDFANQGPFLVNRQEGARLYTALEAAVITCNRTQPPGSLSPALVAQCKANIVQFFRLRAEALLEWCQPPAGTPHRQDVALIAGAIVSQYSGVRRALDYAQQAIAELCAGRHNDPAMENAAFLSMARPFYEAYLRNGMGHILATAAVKQARAFVPPPFLAAASGDTAAAWATLLGTTTPSPGPAQATQPPPAAAPAPAPPPATPPTAVKGPSPPPRQRSPARPRSPARMRSLPRQRRNSPPRAPDPEPLAIPTSRAIIGGVSPHAHSNFRCPVCSTSGHRGYECPKAFFRAFGRVMPGQRDDGTPDPTAWIKDELVPAARADLAEYLRWTRVPVNRRCPVSAALIAASP